MAPPSTKKVQGKLVHVIRHGQAQHNVDMKYLARRDTQLTCEGLMQARALRRVLSRLKPDVAVTSAVLRALQTTRAMGFRGRGVVVVPEARELGGHAANAPVDPRRATSGDLRRDFGKYDWSLALREAKACKERRGTLPQARDTASRWELSADVHRRARRLTRFLASRPEKSIALVSHGEFLMELTGDTYMGNCELRTYRVYRGKWLRVRRRDGGSPAPAGAAAAVATAPPQRRRKGSGPPSPPRFRVPRRHAGSPAAAAVAAAVATACLQRRGKGAEPPSPPRLRVRRRDEGSPAAAAAAAVATASPRRRRQGSEPSSPRQFRGGGGGGGGSELQP